MIWGESFKFMTTLFSIKFMKLIVPSSHILCLLHAQGHADFSFIYIFLRKFHHIQDIMNVLLPLHTDATTLACSFQHSLEFSFLQSSSAFSHPLFFFIIQTCFSLFKQWSSEPYKMQCTIKQKCTILQFGNGLFLLEEVLFDFSIVPLFFLH